MCRYFEIFFINHHWGPCRHFGGADLGYFGTVRNKHGCNETNEKRTGESDHTPFIHLLSTSLASCNLKIDSGALFHTLYGIITNSQCFRNRECSSSFSSILRAHSSIEILCLRHNKKTCVDPK